MTAIDSLLGRQVRAVDMPTMDNECQEQLEVEVGRFTCTHASFHLVSLRLC